MKEVLALIAALFSAAPLSTSWPTQHENATATRLLATVERFGDDFTNIRRGVVPPAFLDKHAGTIGALRAQIISNERPVWSLNADDILDGPWPPLRMHFRLFAVLRADALAQHAKGNDAAAWADLHAMWILSQALLQRPENISVRTALIGRRLIGSTAAQIGTPQQAWWRELESFDARPAVKRSLDYEAWLMRTRAERYPLGEPDGTLFDAFRTIAAPIARPLRLVQANLVIRNWQREAMK